jgi:hypothetical protein
MINLKKGWLLLVSCSSLLGSESCSDEKMKEIKINEDVSVSVCMDRIGFRPDEHDRIEGYGKAFSRPDHSAFGLFNVQNTFGTNSDYVRNEHDDKAQLVETSMTGLKQDLLYRRDTKAAVEELAKLIDYRFIITEADRQNDINRLNMLDSFANKPQGPQKNAVVNAKGSPVFVPSLLIGFIGAFFLINK